MADSQASARRRKAEEKGPVEDVSEKEQELQTTKKKTTKAKVDDDDAYSPWLDILRVLTFLLVASCALSYLISSGETFTWGMKNPPKYLQLKWWKQQFTGPIYLTLDELAAYDGSDPTKPIYLAINGSIYDVSSNPGTYGKGGSYQYFAGADAARAYVTGCFAEDRTPDMRGVELMYLPIDDPSIDRHWSREELAALKEKELEAARKKVHDGLAHWVNFFKDSPKYPFVGYVRLPKGWPGTEPVRRLCDNAQARRERRKVPGTGK